MHSYFDSLSFLASLPLSFTSALWDHIPQESTHIHKPISHIHKPTYLLWKTQTGSLTSLGQRMMKKTFFCSPTLFL